MTKRRASWLRRLSALGVLGALLVMVGFLMFAAVATREPAAKTVTADGIVVLTGGGQRIETAGRLLRDGRGKRLLISGVNRIASKRDLMRLTGLSEDIYECCVDIDRNAVDTIGNARETAKWVRNKGYRSVIVVTASYHMPRSMAELARELPAVALHPHPVVPASFADSPWWLEIVKIRTLAAEFVKFLPSAGRYLLAQVWTQEPPPRQVEREPKTPLPGRLAGS